MSYNRDPALLTFFNSFGNHAPGGTKITFNGYYIYATWYLTGESRAEAYATFLMNSIHRGTIMSNRSKSSTL